MAIFGRFHSSKTYIGFLYFWIVILFKPSFISPLGLFNFGRFHSIPFFSCLTIWRSPLHFGMFLVSEESIIFNPVSVFHHAMKLDKSMPLHSKSFTQSSLNSEDSVFFFPKKPILPGFFFPPYFNYGSSMYLTLTQTTNLRFFQTERISRRQFQSWWNWQKIIQMARKHWGKRRNCPLRAISPFPTVFSKVLYCRYVKSRVCLGKG